MRLFLGLCALAISGSAASAQMPGTTRPGDRSDQYAPKRQSATQRADSLRLSRREAIAEALIHERAARDRARADRAGSRVVVRRPSPFRTRRSTAGFDQETAPFSFGGAASRPVAIGLSLPLPDKFRLNNRIGLADIRSFESNYKLQQQTIALQASATYDSLLVALMHRGNLREARQLAADFLTRTQARYEGWHRGEARRHPGASDRRASPKTT